MRTAETLRTLHETIARDPDLADRTRAMLHGELECPDIEEDDMQDATFHQIALRIPRDIPKRADALIRKLNTRPEQIARGPLNRSDVLRLALLRGIELLESETRAKRG